MPTEMIMPRYQSHKKVWALKIAAMEILADKSARIVPADEGYPTFTTRAGWAERFDSSKDDTGYFVEYEDGFMSWSPTEAFEGGYTPIAPKSGIITKDEMAAAAAVAPRVSLADIEANIADEIYINRDNHLLNDLEALTICVLKMRNGFTIVGTSAPASPENFNAELGRRFARDRAINQAWGLMGYALREKLAAGG